MNGYCMLFCVSSVFCGHYLLLGDWLVLQCHLVVCAAAPVWPGQTASFVFASTYSE